MQLMGMQLEPSVDINAPSRHCQGEESRNGLSQVTQSARHGMRLARITGPKGGAGDRLLVARQAPSSAAVQKSRGRV